MHDTVHAWHHPLIPWLRLRTAPCRLRDIFWFPVSFELAGETKPRLLTTFSSFPAQLQLNSLPFLPIYRNQVLSLVLARKEGESESTGIERLWQLGPDNIDKQPSMQDIACGLEMVWRASCCYKRQISLLSSI
ncbi:putative tyrosine-protein phosphatase [Iris pallida]|uniref:Tyrosine-protein phosphatase n=1 Tax=Iris pallida TaxID=29817 RepID=A0AAX6E161_IRIPA|nr:putative tyrosine-protein phosphatase [Iris pallida]